MVKFGAVFYYICAMFSVLQNITKSAIYKQNRYFYNVLPMFYLFCIYALKPLLILNLYITKNPFDRGKFNQYNKKKGIVTPDLLPWLSDKLPYLPYPKPWF
jgi:hypothetical protein